nr:RB1-inducible coiled-coil protein 1 [Ciona intestinalis]|eukprot:XP_002122437.1 RB1-inducible coiled-coil protein 1 [Ciona intestinalis]
MSLHVFLVNRGHMTNLDVDWAMKRVSDLKRAVSTKFDVKPEKQVMLTSGGQVLDDEQKVCSYPVGTESNPIYLFNKSMMEQSALLSNKTIVKSGFDKEIHNSLHLPVCYGTLHSRTQLAMQIHEETRHQVATMETLVADEHLMFQGWQAAVSNLHVSLVDFKQRLSSMRDQCSLMLSKSTNHIEVLNGFEEVLEMLSRIPVVESLLKSDESSGVTLLEWIEGKSPGVKIADLIEDCRQRVSQLTTDKLSALLLECDKVTTQATNPRMREISGIVDRLAALDHVINAARQQVAEQRGIAQGFVKNQDTARDLQEGSMNRDTLRTLCESHVTQLQIMRDNESATREALIKCDSAKSELAQNLHTRLRWLHFVQRSILNADVKISMFREQLTQLCHQVEFLTEVKKSPEIYFSSVAECKRRKYFSQAFTQWTDGVLAASKVARDREIVRRKNFKSEFKNHFLQKLFPGFTDRPPLISKRPIRPFDLNLPQLTDNEVDQLGKLFPEFKPPQVQPSIACFPDATQLSWQLVVSTSTKTTLDFQQSSIMPSMTSQSMMSSIDSIPPQGEAIQPVDQSDQRIFRSLKPDTDYTTGGFVTSSIQNIIDDKITKSEFLKSFETPRLLSPPSVEVGSPDSGEFFSILPLEPHAPPTPMTPITEGVQQSTPSKNMEQSKMLTSEDTDEMFHSFTSDVEKEKVLKKIKELEENNLLQNEESNKLIRKLQEEVDSLQRSRDAVVADFDRRWSESRGELENVIGQLEREQEERRSGWEEEEKLRREIKELEAKCLKLEENNNSLKTEVAAKVGLMSEIESDAKCRINEMKIEVAHAEEKSEREVWAVKRDCGSEVEALKMKNYELEKELSQQVCELVGSGDRVQELEEQLSVAEGEVVRLKGVVLKVKGQIEGHEKVVAEGRVAVSNMEDELRLGRDKVAQAERTVAKLESTNEELTMLLGGYEGELERCRGLEGEVRECNVVVEELNGRLEVTQQKLDDVSGKLLLSQQELSESENKYRLLVEEFSKDRETLNEKYLTLEGDMEKLKSKHEEDFEKFRENLKTENEREVEIMKQQVVDVESKYQQEIQQNNDKWSINVDEINKKYRSELDEMEADRLLSVVSAQQLTDDAKQKFQRITNEHESLLVVVETLRSENEKLKASQNLNVPSMTSSLMTSQLMTSSNGEKESKRTKMDDSIMTSSKYDCDVTGSMVVSLQEHQMTLESAYKSFESQRNALETSYKKKEEDATRRRQMVFNSAIQRVTSAKDDEIQRLRKIIDESATAIVSQHDSGENETAASSSTKLKEKISISNFEPGDLVLVTYDTHYRHHVVVTLTHTLHFLHNDSMNELGLKHNEPSNKTWLLSRFIDREYCQARKPNNRFKVPVGTKFYRVRLSNVKK